MENVTDDLFEQFAADQQKEAEDKALRGSSSGGKKDYVEIEWTGLEKDTTKIVRAIGGPPDSDVDEFTARTVRVAWLIGDDKKKFRVILPEAADDPDHILWNIISRVKRSEWVNGERNNPVEKDHPEIFNLVAKNGLTNKDKSFIFDRGWTGRHVLLMNVIDREKADWHKENKHTVLVSRSIGVSADGTKTYPEVGVPSFGFVNALGNLFKFYKSWEKYDIGITRTGLKETPYRVVNASKYIDEIPDHIKGLVSSAPLTDEEREYEQYDLKKLFQYTNNTKIYNHLKGRIARIDAALDTNFLSELKHKVDKEKEKFLEEKAVETREDLEKTVSQPVEKVFTDKTPVTRATRTVVSGTDFSKLKGWSVLSQEEKDGIIGVDFDVTPIVVEYKNPGDSTPACPSCYSESPESYTSCPACGLPF